MTQRIAGLIACWMRRKSRSDCRYRLRSDCR